MPQSLHLHVPVHVHDFRLPQLVPKTLILFISFVQSILEVLRIRNRFLRELLLPQYLKTDLLFEQWKSLLDQGEL